VLYLQEDYFLKGTVNNAAIEELVERMVANPQIGCIHLTDFAVRMQGHSKWPGLDVVSRKQRYKVSCQAALWRKSVLLDLLRAHENAWQFEEFGSSRSVIRDDVFLVVDVQRPEYREIIPYVGTGIVQGRWFEEVIELFEEHGIEIDYGRRGMLADAPKRSLSDRLKSRGRKLPAEIRSRIELLLMRLAPRKSA